MSELNPDQFPRTWGVPKPSYPHSKCQGPGPYGAGCEDEGLSSTYHPPGAFAGTSYGQAALTGDLRICRNCAGQAKSQKFYDQNKSAYDAINRQQMPITAAWQEDVEHEVGGERFTIKETRKKTYPPERPPS